MSLWIVVLVCLYSQSCLLSAIAVSNELAANITNTYIIMQIRYFKINFPRLIFLGLIFIGTISCVEKQLHSFRLGETSVVLFSFQNVSDSLNLSLYNLPIIQTSKFEKKTFVLPKESKKQFVIPCEYPSLIHFYIGNKAFTGFTYPTDTLKIFVRMKNTERIDTIYFEGITKEICRYYQEKKQQLQYQDLRVPLNKVALAPKEILHNTDSLMNNELTFLDNYLKNKILPDWFIQTERNQILYLCNSFKVSQETYVTRFLNKPFNSGTDYYKSIDTLKIDNPQAIYSYWYFSFLKNYLVHKKINGERLSTKEWMDLTTKTALSKANENLTGEVRDIFEYNALNSYLNWTKELKNYDQIFLEHKNKFSLQYYLNDLIKKRSLLTDSIVLNRNDEYRNITKNAVKENDSIPYFYLPDINGDFYSSKRFKGKIIYINFWATWCKSCVASIPDKNVLIEKFKDSDNVVFLNICVLSEKDNWEKIVTEKKLNGINLFANKNWSDMLIQKYNLSEYPTYFLIQDGLIIKPYCDGPENIEDDIVLIVNRIIK